MQPGFSLTMLAAVRSASSGLARPTAQQDQSYSSYLAPTVPAAICFTSMQGPAAKRPTQVDRVREGDGAIKQLPRCWAASSCNAGRRRAGSSFYAPSALAAITVKSAPHQDRPHPAPSGSSCATWLSPLRWVALNLVPYLALNLRKAARQVRRAEAQNGKEQTGETGYARHNRRRKSVFKR
jgi:hypothetical protein